MRSLSLLAFVLTLVSFACTSASPAAAPQGPYAGAGCDSSIHAHCVFPSGIGDSAIGPACIEYSGASLDHSECVLETLLPRGQYATGPCPRTAASKSCAFAETPADDAGTCKAFETIWSDSPQWEPDAGIPGFPFCLAR